MPRNPANQDLRRARAVPAVNRVVSDVDVSTLGDYVLANMEPPIWRGIWFPVGYADAPTTDPLTTDPQ